MPAIATKFVGWEVPPLDSLCNSIVYKMRELVNTGVKLNRAQKNWITNHVNNNSYFKTAVPLQGWCFRFGDILKKYVVKQHGQCSEYYAVDKTSLKEYLGNSGIEYIIEIKNV